MRERSEKSEGDKCKCVNIMERIKGRGKVPLKVVMSRGKVSTRGKGNPKNGEWPRWRWSTGGALRLVGPRVEMEFGDVSSQS